MGVQQSGAQHLKAGADAYDRDTILPSAEDAPVQALGSQPVKISHSGFAAGYHQTWLSATFNDQV